MRRRSSASCILLLAAVLSVTAVVPVFAAPTAELLHSSQAGGFPSLSTAATPNQPAITASAQVTVDANLRPRELADSPMAPLPPALVAGPIGILMATWTAIRANRRGGKI